MPSLKYYVKGGVTLTRTEQSGSINGAGSRKAGSQVFHYPENFVVTNTNSGAHTTFSASSIANLQTLVNDVTGDGMTIPATNGSQLFNGGYSNKSFFGESSDANSADFKGTGGRLFNPSTGSNRDGVDRS